MQPVCNNSAIYPIHFSEQNETPHIEAQEPESATTAEAVGSPEDNPSTLGKIWSSIKQAPVTVKNLAKELKRQTTTLYYAYQDPRCPTMAKVVAIATVAYALSPIDLIPDFIPVLGYLDDIIIVPLGVVLAKKLIPAEVLEDARKKAIESEKLPKNNYKVAACIVGLWVAGAAIGGIKVAQMLGYL